MTIDHLLSDGRFHLPTATPAYAPSLRLEPIHGEIHFQPDLEAQLLQCSVIWHIQSNVNGATTITDFDNLFEFFWEKNEIAK